MDEERDEEQVSQEEPETKEKTEVKSPSENPSNENVSFPTAKKRKRKGSKKAIVIIVVLLIALGVGGWFLFSNPLPEDETASPTPTPQDEQSTPTPSVSEEAGNREEVVIVVLNGTGIAQEAAFLQGELEALGYTDIETGNADEDDQQDTDATFSSLLSQAIIDEITEELEGIYKKVNVKTSSSADDDVTIIIGFRKGHTPTPTQSAAPTEGATPTASPSATPSI